MTQRRQTSADELAARPTRSVVQGLSRWPQHKHKHAAVTVRPQANSSSKHKDSPGHSRDTTTAAAAAQWHGMQATMTRSMNYDNNSVLSSLHQPIKR